MTTIIQGVSAVMTAKGVLGSRCVRGDDPLKSAGVRLGALEQVSAK
jgi:hypothetical protein